MTSVRESLVTFPGARVLLAEDDDEFRHIIATALTRDGYEIVEAKDGTEFVDLLACALSTGSLDREFDLIITDIRMPGYSGLDVLFGIHQTQGAPPVVVITAFGDAETHERARRFGSVGVLDKPFELDDLRMVVINSLGERFRRRASGPVSD